MKSFVRREESVATSHRRYHFRRIYAAFQGEAWVTVNRCSADETGSSMGPCRDDADTVMVAGTRKAPFSITGARRRVAADKHAGTDGVATQAATNLYHLFKTLAPVARISAGAALQGVAGAFLILRFAGFVSVKARSVN